MRRPLSPVAEAAVARTVAADRTVAEVRAGLAAAFTGEAAPRARPAVVASVAEAADIEVAVTAAVATAAERHPIAAAEIVPGVTPAPATAAEDLAAGARPARAE